jgi:hypothetical protein
MDLVPTQCFLGLISEKSEQGKEKYSILYAWFQLQSVFQFKSHFEYVSI